MKAKYTAVLQFATDKNYRKTEKELTKELKDMGVKITYSMKLLIRETTAIDFILREIECYLGVLPTVVEKIERKLGSINQEYQGKKSMNYCEIEIGKEMFSLFADEYPKMQKRLIYLLNELGLSPKQYVIREKIKLISKLDKKLIEIKDKDFIYNVNAVHEKEIKL